MATAFAGSSGGDEPPAWALPLLAMAAEYNTVKADVSAIKASAQATELRMNAMEARVSSLESDGRERLKEMINSAENKFKVCVAKAQEAADAASSTPSTAPSSVAGSGGGWHTVGAKRSRTLPRGQGGRAGEPDDDGREHPQGATRVVMLGFARPLLADTLKTAARLMVAKLLPTADQAKMTMKAYDLTRKVILDFQTAADCSSFLMNLPKAHNFEWKDVAGGVHVLRLRRDLRPESRRLFAVMGRVRADVTQRMKDMEHMHEVRSNGLGGEIYCMEANDMPLSLFSCKLVGQEVEVKPHFAALEKLGLKDVVRDILAAGELAERPFR